MELNVINFGVPIGQEFMSSLIPPEIKNESQCHCTNNCYQGNCSSTCTSTPPTK